MVQRHAFERWWLLVVVVVVHRVGEVGGCRPLDSGSMLLGPCFGNWCMATIPCTGADRLRQGAD